MSGGIFKVMLLAALCLRCLSAGSEEPSGDGEEKWHKGIFRVNTDVSSGGESISSVASKANAAGMDFVVFSDQFLVECRYGVLPFRNILYRGISRHSIVSYGIEKYIQDIRNARTENPRMALIVGADIAPRYYWTGNPFSGNLTCNQFSEQLTVFGPEDPAFYRNMPVLHNEHVAFSMKSIVKGLPLLISLASVLLWIRSRKAYYRDAQGNAYRRKGIAGKLVLTALFVGGMLWTIDNRPLREDFGFDQYSRQGVFPCQQSIDYVGRSPDGKTGIIWSAPEATMKMSIGPVSLITIPYLDDIRACDGFTGMAGIYGDAYTALRPGAEWDGMILSYCKGTRKSRPVIVGELDYHGEGERRIDVIQTVVRTKTLSPASVCAALKKGASYAVTNDGNSQLELDHVSLSSGGSAVSLGGEIALNGPSQVEVSIKGGLDSKNTRPAPVASDVRMTIICDGKIYSEKMVSSAGFEIAESLEFNAPGRHYVRIMLDGDRGRLVTNPVYVVIE